MVEILTYILIGLSLSIDAMTVSISYGIIINNIKEKIFMILSVGIFHLIMPIIGYKLGCIIDNAIIIKTKYIAIMIFIFLLFDIIKNKPNENEVKNFNYITIILTSFGVSIDSLTIGIILGLSNEKILLASAFFSIISAFMTFIGINIGKEITKKGNKKSKIVVIILLIIVIIKYVLYD